MRPEALSDKARARFETGETVLPMKVWLVQPLGGTMHIHLSTGRHGQVVAHVDAGGGVSVGDSIPIYFDPSRLHFFEAGELGKSLVDHR